MSSRNGAEATLASRTQQQENGPVATAMDAKLMVATGSGDVQQLKDLVSNQEQEDSKMMVVVIAKQQPAASAGNPRPQQGNMDPRLFALASSGSSEKLRVLLNGEDYGQSSGHGSTTTTTWSAGQSSGHGIEAHESILEIVTAQGDDIEANVSILEGVTAQGDTALHVVAASGQGDNFFTKFGKEKHLLHVQRNSNSNNDNGNGDGNGSSTTTNNNTNNRRQRWLFPHERHALTTYGDGDNFLNSARIINEKAKHLLFVQNNNGDTPLHFAARAEKSNMVKYLIQLAAEEGEGRVKELLQKENKHKETALHDAIRVGNKDIVDMLMEEDSELASFPQDGGASPMYLALELRQDEIVKTLFDKSIDGNLSFSGSNGQNALHAAVLRYPDLRQGTDLTKLLKWNETHLSPQNKDLTTQRDENGSTPLHFAAAITSLFGPSSICRQVLEANPDALYQPDDAGFFPIHVAAFVGASGNVDMFVKKCPGSAGLRDAKGRTFLHVAVKKGHTNIIVGACRNLTLSWIMNMADDDGNTALHLAVEAGRLLMFCPLLANPQVNLNLPNSRGETPLDIANYNIPEDGLFYTQNSEAQISRTLKIAGAKKGVRRLDHFKDKKTLKAKRDESKLLEVVKDSTGILCIGSVLIATVTFGATFAVPGGYIADDHSNGGSPILARRYAFDAFIASNTLAFVFSAMATMALMQSGSPVFNPRSRILQLGITFPLLSFSITCLTAAFALGAYVVLDPVSHKTAVATCVLTSLVLLYKHLEFILRRLLLLRPLSTRKGLIGAWLHSASVILGNLLVENCPLIFIFGWAACSKPADDNQK